VTAVRLREWRGVKPVPGSTGTVITTRLRTTRADDAMLDAVAGHLGRLRRADLGRVCRPTMEAAGETGRQGRRDGLNSRKRNLTALSSARWANAIIAANDAQYRSAREAQGRHTADLRTAIATIEKRLAQPTADRLTREERAARKKSQLPKGYPPARPDKNAATAPGNRCPGTGRQRPNTSVTVSGGLPGVRNQRSVRSSTEASGSWWVPLVFKTSERRAASLAGSIPVRLRHQH
jgi:hypothetical protein